MRLLWKDILAALLIGMVLPALMLNAGLLFLRRDTPISSIRITIPEETKPSGSELPVKLRLPEGRTEEWNMEDYLTWVVLAEMPVEFEPEALKAQAVAARTYARKAWVTGGKHGDGSVCTQPGCCQGYITEEQYLSRGGTEQGIRKAAEAVRATAGICLQYEGELIEATYFSCSGGKTEDAAAVWGAEYPYLQSVDSPGEEEAAWFSDTVVLSGETFARTLGLAPDGTPETWFGETTFTEGGGVAAMEIGGTLFTGTQLRSLLGLRSTAFTVEHSPDSVTITTRGYGHRVGMSQYGAEAMAVNGSSYAEILAHYYPGAELVTVLPQPLND